MSELLHAVRETEDVYAAVINIDYIGSFTEEMLDKLGVAYTLKKGIPIQIGARNLNYSVLQDMKDKTCLDQYRNEVLGEISLKYRRNVDVSLF